MTLKSGDLYARKCYGSFEDVFIFILRVETNQIISGYCDRPNKMTWQLYKDSPEALLQILRENNYQIISQTE